MTIENIRDKRKFNKLLKQYTDELLNEVPNNGFKAINIYKGWQSDATEWLLKRLDHEVFNCNDILKITDIKYKPHRSQLSINYISIKKGIDYDDIIESLAAISSEPQIL